MNIPDRTILFLFSSNGFKSRIVLNHLLEKDWILENFEIGAVVDSKEGPVTDMLSQSELNYQVATSVNSPSEAVRKVFSSGPDYLISCGWGHYIHKDTIETALIKAMNCHGSYLPEYRGPNAYRAMWANGCETGGATVHVLTEEFDDGKILTRERFNIAPFDTPREIAYKASELTTVLIREAILLVELGFDGIENEDGSYYGKLTWPETIARGTVNNLLRLGGINWRWEVTPR